MATYTSAATGPWSAGATWSGGVKPPSGAGHKIVLASPYTVEYDEAAGEYGDDTSTGITIASGATLKFSRTASTSLTCRGTLVNSGTIDAGTEADPIPSTYTATIIGNYSASLASNKWSITSSGTGAKWKLWGKTRKRLTTLTAPTIISDTVFPVADATGWEVGDIIVFGPPSNSTQTITARAITGISGLNITAGAALSEASSSGRRVINISSNVKMTGHLPQTYSQLVKTLSNTSASAAIELGHVEFIGGGSVTGGAIATALAGSAAGGVTKISGIVGHNIVSVSGSTVTACPSMSGYRTFSCIFGDSGVAEEIIAVSHGGVALTAGIGSGANQSIEVSSLVVAGTAFAIGPTASSGINSASLKFGSITGLGITTTLIGTVSGASAATLLLEVSGGTFVGLSRIYNDAESIAQATFTGVDFGSGSTGMTNMNDAFPSFTAGFYTKTMFDACLFPSNFAISRAAAVATAPTVSEIVLRSINNDPTDQRRVTAGGLMIRENSVVYRGLSSVRMDCWFTGVAQTYSYTVTVGAGEVLHLIGAMRYTSTYGTSTPPTVTVSGLGITPVVETCPTSGADTWFEYDITATNPQAYAGKFTVTFTGQSAANSSAAYCYFDGHVDPPWIEVTRHYGHLYNNSPSLVDDPTITISEAAALALAVSVDHDYQIITVSGALTNAEVYQACMADLAQTASLYPTLRAVHITSDDGEDFTTTYDVILDGGSPTSIITGPYTDAAGRHVLIEAPALVSGSRVQIYNVTDAVELYNDVLSVTGVEFPVVWSSNKTIRLRADHEDKLPLEVAGVLGASGLVFLDIQEDDDVYASNAIDGSTCTEFAPDGVNIQIDIDDPDGVTSVRRVYAWLQYYQTTEAGIASDFFGAIEAIDDVNYIVDQALIDLQLDNISATPVRIIDGYMARKDGSTVIAPSSGSIQMDPRKAYAAADIRDTVTRSEKWLRNKRVTNPSTGTQTVYDDDGVTVLGAGALYEDVAGTQAYRGQGADRADRLA